MQQLFSRSFDELENIVQMTQQVCAQVALPKAKQYVVDLATEELFVNMVNYNTETTEKISISIAPKEGGVEVSLTDYDVERFDPANAPEVDLNAGINERTPGGLGVYLVLKMVDSISYEYRNRQSKITFSVGGNTSDV
jgi:anti-sigma regulatory factor (Ser/Thr protein kinase)